MLKNRDGLRHHYFKEVLQLESLRRILSSILELSYGCLRITRLSFLPISKHRGRCLNFLTLSSSCRSLKTKLV